VYKPRQGRDTQDNYWDKTYGWIRTYNEDTIVDNERERKYLEHGVASNSKHALAEEPVVVSGLEAGWLGVRVVLCRGETEHIRDRIDGGSEASAEADGAVDGIHTGVAIACVGWIVDADRTNLQTQSEMIKAKKKVTYGDLIRRGINERRAGGRPG
jgi:hypothetical protein